jgi:glycosyltransferase involved in cell wall biosynthesis
MRIAVYTLTRDRLEYTKHCFETLRSKAGVSFDHFVLDNGSQDGTKEWLEENRDMFKRLNFQTENVGISKGSNICLDAIGKGYDLIIKMDNDCEVVSDNILGQIAEIYEAIGEFSPKYVLSPRVEGINNQPTRGRFEQIAGRRIGLTAIVGGLFHIVPSSVYGQYRYPLNLPKAHGQDDVFCKWIKDNGGQVGYIEGLVVNHYEGTDNQAKRFPEYFTRKWQEEKL